MEAKNMKESNFSENYVREVTAKYIGPRRKGLFISGPSDAANFMRGLLRDEAREHFLALYLNGANCVISFSLVSLGCATSAPAHPREVFQGAVLVGACGVLIGHNLCGATHKLCYVKRLLMCSECVRGLKQLPSGYINRLQYFT